MKKIFYIIYGILFLSSISYATTYYSRSTGVWNSTRWSTTPTGTATYAATANESSNNFIIQSGHTITLSINSTVGLVSVTGTGKLQRSNNSFNFTGNVVIGNGATYIHNIDGGTIPSYTWNSGSICYVQAISAATVITGMNQVFSNFTWNCVSQSNVFNISGLGDVTNTLTVQNAGGGLGLTIESLINKSITGSLNIQDVLEISNSQNTSFYVKDVTLNGGFIYLSNDINVGRLIVSGSLNWSSGSISVPNGGNGEIIFSNTSSKTASFPSVGSQFNAGENISIIINSGSSLDISASLDNISLEDNQAMTVSGTLITGGMTITANGSGSNFSLANNATINTSNSSGVSGTILAVSGTTTFNNGASYIISGGGNLSLPNTTMKNLTINILQVTAVSNLSITGDLVLSSSIDPATFTVYLGGNLSGTGNIFYGTGTSAFVFNGNTVISGTGNRNINNLSITGSLTAPSGLISVNGNFINVGAFSHGNGTIDLTSSISRTVSNADFYTLSASGNPPVTYNGTIGIANTWSPGSGPITQNGTFNFNGSTSQSINVVTYRNLQTAGSGIKTLSGNTTFTGNITVGNGTTLSIAGVDLELSGDLSILGTLNQTSGTIFLIGSNNQAISGSTTFNNLTINKSTSGDVAIPSGTIGVSGFLNILSLNGSNKLNTNGNLTLTSNASSTGSLIDFSTAGSGGSVNGNITVQRAHNGTGNPRIFGSPIASSTVYTLGQGTYNVLLFTESGQSPDPPRVAGYNNSFSSSFRNATLLGNNLTVGRGYSIRKNSNGALNFIGVPNNGTIQVPVTYTTGTLLGISPSSSQGSNLLSNPYPSAIDWTLVNVGGTGVSNTAVSIWNGSTYTATNVIPSGTGFFVQATASGNITFTNAARIGSGTGNNTVYRTAQKSKWFYLNVTSISGGYYDALAVTFNDDATSGFDFQYDLRKIYAASGPLMYSGVGTEKLSLSTVPYPQTETTVPVTLRIAKSGSYKFTTSSFADWYNDYDVYLKDSTSSGVQLINLRDGLYQFSKSATETDTSSRFSLVFKYNSVPGVNTNTGGNTGIGDGGGSPDLTVPGAFLAIPDQELQVQITLDLDKPLEVKESSLIYSDGKNIYIHFAENISSKSDFVIYDYMGTIIYESKGILSSGKLIIPLPYNEKSVYIVKLINAKESIIKKILLY